MEYTVSKEADKKIEEDAKIIKEIIIKNVNPRAIIMFGGFGHGGGSFKKTGKKILPLNDYDLYVITDKKISEKLVGRLETECAKAIGRGGKEIVRDFSEKYDVNQFFHVDLHFLETKKLESLYPTQRAFDLKTSLVIYGDKNILNRIPEIKISKSDAVRILFNKINHFSIAERNSEMIKSIYAVKGFTDLCSAILIFEGKYVSRYQDKCEVLESVNVPKELKELVKKAVHAKLYNGYEVKNPEKFYEESKKWVEWTLKNILKKHLHIKSDEWKTIFRVAYKKLPYVYFNDYLKSRFLFWGQYYLNIRFFLEGINKGEFPVRALSRWRDAGLIIAFSMALYAFGEKEEAERYLRKLTGQTFPLKERIMKLYSIYYLQKLI